MCSMPASQFDEAPVERGLELRRRAGDPAVVDARAAARRCPARCCAAAASPSSCGRLRDDHRLGVAGEDDARDAELAGLREHVGRQRVGDAERALGHRVAGGRRDHHACGSRSAYSMPTGTALARLVAEHAKALAQRSQRSARRCGSTSSPAADRNRSTFGSARERERFLEQWPSRSRTTRSARGARTRRAAGAEACVWRASASSSMFASCDSRDVQLVHLAVQRVAADTERLGDVAHVPAVPLEQLEQHLRAPAPARGGKGRRVRLRVAGPAAPLARRLVRRAATGSAPASSVAPSASATAAAQHVMQLAHVAGPWMAHQQVPGRRASARRRRRPFVGEHVADQLGAVAGARAAAAAAARCRPGGSTGPRGSGPRPPCSRRSRWLALTSWKSTGCGSSAPSGVTMRSSSTRSSRACSASGMSPISSRNSVPPSACAILPRAPALVRAGEGAGAVAEQLGLDQRLGQARAVDRDERPVGARAGGVHARARTPPCRCRSRPRSSSGVPRAMHAARRARDRRARRGSPKVERAPSCRVRPRGARRLRAAWPRARAGVPQRRRRRSRTDARGVVLERRLARHREEAAAPRWRGRSTTGWKAPRDGCAAACRPAWSGRAPRAGGRAARCTELSPSWNSALRLAASTCAVVVDDQLALVQRVDELGPAVEVDRVRVAEALVDQPVLDHPRRHAEQHQQVLLRHAWSGW